MRPVHVLSMIALVLTQSASAQALDKEALRKAAIPPSFTIPWMCVTSPDGFRFPHEQTRAWIEKRIQTLNAQIKGDASDAELYFALGRLDQERTDKAYRESARLYLQRVKTRPNDGHALAQLGHISYHFGMFDEAEALNRRAVEVAPDDWRTWAALSLLLDNARADTLLTESMDQLLDENQELEQRLKAAKARLARVRAILAESRTCCEKAIALAPREPLAYMRRVQHLMAVMERFNPISAAVANPGAMRQCLLQGSRKWSLEMAADIEKMAELDPRNSATAAAAVLFSYFANLAAVAGSPALASPENRRDFYEKRLKSTFERASARLVALTEKKDPVVVAQAAESLGALSFMFSEFGTTLDPAPWFRLAVEADPTRDVAWLFLIKTVPQDEALVVCKKRLALSESALFRFFHGKLLAKRDLISQAEREYRAGLRHDPDNVYCRAGLAATLIRRGDEAGLKEAADNLRLANEGLAKITPPVGLLNDLHALSAIVAALRGNEESAKSSLQKALQGEPNHELATNVYNIVYDIPAGPPKGSLPASSMPDPDEPRITLSGQRFERLPGALVEPSSSDSTEKLELPPMPRTTELGGSPAPNLLRPSGN